MITIGMGYRQRLGRGRMKFLPLVLTGHTMWRVEQPCEALESRSIAEAYSLGQESKVTIFLLNPNKSVALWLFNIPMENHHAINS